MKEGPSVNRILVVDDDPASLAGMVELLRRSGYEASGASGFDDAKRVLSIEPPDLLIVDVRLGAFNGLHLVVRQRALYPDRPIIVITGFYDAMLEAEATRQGAAYVAKPIEPGAFLAMVARMLPAGARTVGN